MNYYEQHIGDYAKDAGHLSMLEDGAYRRLMDAYYSRERALPADVRDCCKLARAATKPERDAVAYVLREFFELREDGYHQKRCDEEIARFQDKQDKARRSANARWNKDESGSDGNANASSDGIRTHSEGNAPRARPQTPSTNHQASYVEGCTDTPAAPAVAGQFEGHADPRPTPNPAAPHAVALNHLGHRCTAMNPELVAFVAEGGTVEHLTDVASLPECAGKPASYVVKIARRELAEKAQAVTTGPPRNSGKSKTLNAIETLMRGTTDGQRAMAERRDPHGAEPATLPAPGVDPG